MFKDINRVVIAAAVMAVALGCSKKTKPVERTTEAPTPAALVEQCEKLVGPPRVERISEHVWLAIGYDLASTVLIHTDEGNIIVDATMNPARARAVKAAFAEKAPAGPVKALVYTHSHIDHIGGAREWLEDGTRIWATAAFTDHFFKQYGLFRPIETIRGMRQFGQHVSKEDLPCSAIGAKADAAGSLESGVRMPTDTFSGTKTLEFGGIKIELIEAHGETHDQLFAWIPSDKTIVAGDNFYWAFPNIYTIRGTSPRPVNDWIASIDAMRRLAPEHLVPCHTKPLKGAEEIRQTLTDYRDAVQWVRDDVVRRANRGENVDTIAESVKLPPRLAEKRYLFEMYGQVDWSARAIYTNELGWHDGSPDAIYTPARADIAKREVTLFGGPDKVIAMANEAIEMKDPRWAVHLLIKLRDSGMATGEMETKVRLGLADAYTKLAEGIFNTNGRAYLLESALELKNGMPEMQSPKLDENLVDKVPLEVIFKILSTRLKPEDSMDVFESIRFVFPDENKTFTVTVRHGVAEVVAGEPLPGTPEPVATMTTNASTYRKIAMNITNPAKAFASGDIKIEGGLANFLKFMGRFDSGI